jgi:hypothetical protein
MKVQVIIGVLVASFVATDFSNLSRCPLHCWRGGMQHNIVVLMLLLLLRVTTMSVGPFQLNFNRSLFSVPNRKEGLKTDRFRTQCSNWAGEPGRHRIQKNPGTTALTVLKAI